VAVQLQQLAGAQEALADWVAGVLEVGLILSSVLLAQMVLAEVVGVEDSQMLVVILHLEREVQASSSSGTLFRFV
jgi:hypothetical protein